MILVAGATGNVGGALVDALAAQGVPVRAVTRRPPDGEHRWPAGVQVAVGDLDDPASLADALIGVRGLFLLSGYAGTAELLAAGKDAGLERVVLLGSGAVTDADLDAPQSSTNVIVAYNVASERTVRASGLSWTVLRPTGFQSNALRWRPQLAAGDVVRGPWADIPIATIDPADIAAVAAVALTDGRQDGRALRLSGPEALTPAARVAILADVLGRPPALRGPGRRDRAGGDAGKHPSRVRRRVLPPVLRRRDRRDHRPPHGRAGHRPPAAILRAVGRRARGRLSMMSPL